MSHRTISSLFFAIGCGLVASGACLTPSVAQAGFEWVSPSDAASTSSSSSSVVTAEVPPTVTTARGVRRPASDSEVISPVVIQGNEVVAAQPVAIAPAAASAPSYAPAAEVPQAPAAAEPLSLTAERQTASVAPSLASGGNKTVQGFANRVPLAVALRQVMPSDYGFSVDKDVALSTTVSWQGGKAWRDVLREMLQPIGLEMREQGQMVKIVRGSGMASNVPASSGALVAPAGAVASASSSLTPAADALSSNADTAKSQGLSLSEPKVKRDVSSSGAMQTGLSSSGSQSVHTLQLPPGMKADVPSDAARAVAAPVAQPVAAPVVTGEGDMMPLAAVPQPAIAETWTANRGDMLHMVLELWARRAHVEFNWKSEYDYPLQASVTISGSFEDAVRNLLAGFQEAQPQPIARLHNNPIVGQSVLLVEARGNNYSE